MAAGQPHGVAAPASSASMSSESESDSYCLVDLDFLTQPDSSATWISSQIQPPHHLSPMQLLLLQEINQQLIVNQQIIQQMQLELKLKLQAEPPSPAMEDSMPNVVKYPVAVAVAENSTHKIACPTDKATPSWGQSACFIAPLPNSTTSLSLTGPDAAGQTCIANHLATVKLSKWINMKMKEEIQTRESHTLT